MIPGFTRSSRVRPNVAVVAFLIAALANLPAPAAGQSAKAFGTCVPRGDARADSVGCFIIVDSPVGTLDRAPVYWTVSKLRGRVSTIATQGGNSTLIDAFGSKWLMTIGARNAHVNQGKVVARIGPLPITPGRSYSALYMEASMTPGMKSAIHTHSGPEAWYTFSGETCLETSKGTMVGRAWGKPVIVPGGLPMELTATGRTVRKSLVLILHDAGRPPTAMESHWKPTGACNRSTYRVR